jgi:hypothetical protein
MRHELRAPRAKTVNNSPWRSGMRFRQCQR